MQDPTYYGPRDMMTDEPAHVGARAIQRELVRLDANGTIRVDPSPLWFRGQAHAERGQVGGTVIIRDDGNRVPYGHYAAAEVLSALRSAGPRADAFNYVTGLQGARVALCELGRRHGAECVP